MRLGFQLGMQRNKRRGRLKTKSDHIAEAAEGGALVFLHVENGEEPRNLQNIVNAPGKMYQLEFAAGTADGRVGRNHLPDAGTVNIVDVAQIEQYFAVALRDEIADRFPQNRTTFAQRDLAAEIDDSDVTSFAACSL
jgi:hypothetical protein